MTFTTLWGVPVISAQLKVSRKIRQVRHEMQKYFYQCNQNFIFTISVSQLSVDTLKYLEWSSFWKIRISFAIQVIW